MVAVVLPSGRVVHCRDEAEADRVREWTAWLVAERLKRERRRAEEERQRAIAARDGPRRWGLGGTYGLLR